jgi:hypothetical protein
VSIQDWTATDKDAFVKFTTMLENCAAAGGLNICVTDAGTSLYVPVPILLDMCEVVSQEPAAQNKLAHDIQALLNVLTAIGIKTQQIEVALVFLCEAQRLLSDQYSADLASKKYRAALNVLAGS